MTYRLNGRSIPVLVAGWLLVTFIALPAHAAVLRDPPRTEFGCELSKGKVKAGIIAGIGQRGWTVTNGDTPGLVVAQIVVRSRHTLVVEINYDSRSYDLTYKSSINLNYQSRDDGVQIIHRNANRWMSNAQADILKQLSSMCVMEAM